MKIKIFKTLAAATTLAVSGLMAAEAQAVTFAKTTAENLGSQNQELLKFFQDNVNGERQALADSELKPLDATGLLFDTSESVEVYFIDEGAGYKNQVLFSADGQSPEMIIENASLQGSGGNLKSGDGFILDNFEGLPSLAQFEFLIASNGYNKSNPHIFGADPTKNPDGINHITAFGYTDQATGDYYTFIGFEDLWNGGDRDFNDVVIVAKGFQNPDAPVDVPEPISGLAVLAVGAVAVGGALKKKMA